MCGGAGLATLDAFGSGQAIARGGLSSLYLQQHHSAATLARSIADALRPAAWVSGIVAPVYGASGLVNKQLPPTSTGARGPAPRPSSRPGRAAPPARLLHGGRTRCHGHVLLARIRRRRRAIHPRGMVRGSRRGPDPAGPLSDRLGRRWPLIVGFTIFAAAMAAGALAQSIATLTVLRFIAALGASAGMVISRAVVRDLTEGREGAILMSRLVLIMNLAPIVAPSIGAAILMVADWRSIFWVQAAYGASCALLAWRLLPETLPEDRRIAIGIGSSLRPYGEILREPLFRTYAIMAGAGSFTLFAWLGGSSPVFIQGFGLSPAEFGLIFSLCACGVIAGSYTNSRVLRHFDLYAVIRGISRLSLAATLILLLLSVAGVQPLWLTVVPLFIVLACQGLSYGNGDRRAQPSRRPCRLGGAVGRHPVPDGRDERTADWAADRWHAPRGGPAHVPGRALRRPRRPCPRQQVMERSLLPSALRGHEHVADAIHRSYRRGILGILLDLSTNTVDAQIDCPIESDHFAMAHLSSIQSRSSGLLGFSANSRAESNSLAVRDPPCRRHRSGHAAPDPEMRRPMRTRGPGSRPAPSRRDAGRS